MTCHSTCLRSAAGGNFLRYKYRNPSPEGPCQSGSLFSHAVRREHVYEQSPEISLLWNTSLWHKINTEHFVFSDKQAIDHHITRMRDILSFPSY
jgi:hypothetical protein